MRKSILALCVLCAALHAGPALAQTGAPAVLTLAASNDGGKPVGALHAGETLVLTGTIAPAAVGEPVTVSVALDGRPVLQLTALVDALDPAGADTSTPRSGRPSRDSSRPPLPSRALRRRGSRSRSAWSATSRRAARGLRRSPARRRRGSARRGWAAPARGADRTRRARRGPEGRRRPVATRPRALPLGRRRDRRGVPRGQGAARESACGRARPRTHARAADRRARDARRAGPDRRRCAPSNGSCSGTAAGA